MLDYHTGCSTHRAESCCCRCLRRSSAADSCDFELALFRASCRRCWASESCNCASSVLGEQVGHQFNLVYRFALVGYDACGVVETISTSNQ